MAEERDPKVSRRYRELGDEEPAARARSGHPRRRAPRGRPAARAARAPAGRHRWYFAFGAAAILVLAVAITVQLDRQQLDPEALPRGVRPGGIGAQGDLRR
jgi:hypothetical protein